MMRGTPWYEAQQQLVLEGRLSQCNKRFLETALPFFGIDPLLDWIPVLESRFSCLEQSAHRKAWESKSKEAHSKRFMPEIRAHLFELSVLGYFSQQNILKETDCPIPNSQSASNIDALVTINSKDIYVEATYTLEQLYPAPTRNAQVMWLPAEEMFDQAAYKVRKKALMGKQLQLITTDPTVLILGRNPWGACEVTAREGVKTLFESEGCENLSGVIISESWRFLRTDVVVNPCARFPLAPEEWALIATGWKDKANAA